MAEAREKDLQKALTLFSETAFLDEIDRRVKGHRSLSCVECAPESAQDQNVG